MALRVHTFTLTPFATNCYVVEDGKEALVFDPGEGAPELLECISSLSVKAIINTHCHCDHCGGNAALKAETGAPLYCHEAELPLLRGLPEQGAFFGVSFEASPDPDGFLDEGGAVTLGDAVLDILFTPGHSPGHLAFLYSDWIISGDVLFAGSVGRTDLPGGAHAELMDTIRTKLLPLPDSLTVYPGHGPPTTIGAERAGNPFLVGL